MAYVCIISLLLPMFALSQDSTATMNDDSLLIHPAKSSYFKFSLGYLSNDVYNGRKDSLQIPYFAPYLMYKNKCGLYAKTSVSYLVSSYAQRIDLFELEGGYEFSIGDNFSGSLKGAKDYYNNASTSVQSEIKGSAGTDLDYSLLNTVDVSGAFSYIFTSGQPDLLFTYGLSHEFTFGAGDEWTVEPTFNSNTGTMHYHDLYRQKRSLKTGKSVKSGDSTVTKNVNETIVTSTNTSVQKPNRVRALDYEFSLPVYYLHKAWSFYVQPNYAIPVNPATYINTVTTKTTPKGGATTTTKTSYKTNEAISNSFYIEIGAAYKITTTKKQKTKHIAGSAF